MGMFTEYLSVDDYCKGESTNEILYLNTEDHSLSFDEIIQAAKEHFGESFNVADYLVSATNVQFRCHGYDLRDEADYANLIYITKK